MTDLHELLERGATPPSDPAGTSPTDDVRRGRAALRRQRQLRGAMGVAGLAAVAVLGVTVGPSLDGLGDGRGSSPSGGPAGRATEAPTQAPTQSPTLRSLEDLRDPSSAPDPEPPPGPPEEYGSRMVEGRVVVGPYSFDSVPRGWQVQGGTAYFVTMVPRSGAPDPYPDSFLDKLVLMYEDDGPGGGRSERFEGREYVVRGDSGHSTVATRTRAGEPRGSLRIQFPDDAGLSEQEMIEFLATVEVEPGVESAAGIG